MFLELKMARTRSWNKVAHRQCAWVELEPQGCHNSRRWHDYSMDYGIARGL